MAARMPRRTFYGIILAVLAGMVWGLLEIVYDLVADSEPGPIGPRWDYQQRYDWASRN
jgi:hypothetical protein